ncbi:exosome complex component RRP40-like [Haliotis asinina]|uniref:exosome complex component RRP40-like n=1 Tax=Haliotis asinina TaxID=109174 RepID=UPI003531EC71
MGDHVGSVFMPGDLLTNLKYSETSGKCNLGPGLRLDEENVYVTKPGILRYREPHLYWIDCHQKRYVAVKGDHVLGVVTAKAGDIFRVDIGTSELASLSYLSFELATKRNRPDVKVGDIVYCRLLVANKDMEPEVVCIDSHGRSSGMGVIRNEGFMFTCSLNLVRKVLSPQCALSKTLGKHLPYEMTVGMNGRIWVRGRSTNQTIAIANAISVAEHMTDPQIKAMVKRLADAIAGI